MKLTTFLTTNLPLLFAPNSLTLSTTVTGGTLPAGSYAYRVTAVNARGETLPSPEVTITVPDVVPDVDYTVVCEWGFPDWFSVLN